MSQTLNAAFAWLVSISARTLSTSWAMMSVVPLCCVRNGRVARSRPGCDPNRTMQAAMIGRLSKKLRPNRKFGVRLIGRHHYYFDSCLAN